MAKTVTNNTWNDKPAGCENDHAAQKELGGDHPKRQPPAPSPFAPAPGAGGSPLTPPPSGTNPNQDY